MCVYICNWHPHLGNETRADQTVQMYRLSFPLVVRIWHKLVFRREIKTPAHLRHYRDSSKVKSLHLGPAMSPEYPAPRGPGIKMTWCITLLKHYGWLTDCYRFCQCIRKTCPCDLYPLTPHFYIVNNYMEGLGSATINNVAHPKHSEEEESLQTETTQLQVNNSRQISSLFPNRGNWSTTIYI